MKNAQATTSPSLARYNPALQDLQPGHYFFEPALGHCIAFCEGGWRIRIAIYLSRGIWREKLLSV